MSENEKQPSKGMIHPWTIFLTNEMQAAAAALQNKKQFEALDHLLTVHCSIDEADADAELYDKIRKEPYRVRSTESLKQVRRSLRTTTPAYWKWYRATAQLLIDKGYLSGEKFGFYDPSGGRKSDKR